MFDESVRGGDSLANPNRLAQAVEAARWGEAQGWTPLFERFYPDVHAYALARLGDLTAAEDVAQDVFVAAVTSIQGLRDPRGPAPQAWFLHICRHKVIDHIRRSSRHPTGAVRVEPAPDPDPSVIAETNLESQRVRAAMTRLTDEQQDILVRRFVLDQSLENVAATTRRSLGAVSMQHRALESLRRALDPRRVA
jgi:RNA polymerase sigma-70 factor (ECF subfamily)